MARPETRYARNGDVHLAYQVVGQGPIDLVYVPGFINNLDLLWDEPDYARLLTRLAAFSRLILFDKRGTGLSDPVAEVPTLEQRMDDVRAVMDAAGSDRAVILGASEGGAMAALFAATHPARTRSLVLYGAYACFAVFVSPPERTAALIAEIEAEWGSGFLLRHFAPARQSEPALRAWWARHERLGASPRMAAQLVQMNAGIDIRPVLPAVRVPALVLHRAGDTRVSPAAGRFLAEHIEGARLAELSGDAHPIWLGDVDSVADKVEAFVTGTRPGRIDAPDRVLATVLAAEVADPERGAAALGDAAWCGRLDGYREEAHGLLAEYRARSAGAVRADGALLASFLRRPGPCRALRGGAARGGPAPAGARLALRLARGRGRRVLGARRRCRLGAARRVARRRTRQTGRGAGLRHGARPRGRLRPALPRAREPPAARPRGRRRAPAAPGARGRQPGDAGAGGPCHDYDGHGAG